jgi:hypothetical protein
MNRSFSVLRAWYIPLLLALGAVLPGSAAQTVAGQEGGTTTYVDPKQQTLVATFGDRSHWLQPWRAYSDTFPTRRLRDAVGINLNVGAEQADAVCAHLQKNGFRLARIEAEWGGVSYEDPERMPDQPRFEKILRACKRHAIRPLIVLNANQAMPCPVHTFSVTVAVPAKKGDRSVRLDPTTAKDVLPGRTGFDNLTAYVAAQVLITSLTPDGTATLSKPLPKDLPAGTARVSTFKYLPFYPLKNPKTGQTYPEFEETVRGWLNFVRLVCNIARGVMQERPDDAGFDLEVWNELTFGSAFLSVNNYYEPSKRVVAGPPPFDEILSRTVAFVTDQHNGWAGAGVCNGFNNQWPWGNGSTAPPGLAALGKHPYAGANRVRTGDMTVRSGRPIDALGRVAGKQIVDGGYRDDFVPSYTIHFPEFGLCALQTETFIRDVSPFVTDIFGTKHGRSTHPYYSDGSPAPAPALWVTEVNLDSRGADPGDATTYAKVSQSSAAQAPNAPKVTAADADHLRAKAALRYLCSFVGKGVARIYFFAARDDNPLGLGFISKSFFDALKAGGNQYPTNDAPLTSETMLAVRRLTAAMPDSARITAPRTLTVTTISDTHGHRQFDGDPATADQHPDPHPPLYNRDCVGVFPFQTSDTTFVVPVYVLTRNLGYLYHPEAPATDITRFDMPDERYRITIRGLKKTGGVRPSLYDPLTDQTAPVRVVTATGDEVTIELSLTDSPRLLLLADGK